MASSASSYSSLLHSSILHDKNLYLNKNDFSQPITSIYPSEDLSFQTFQEKIPLSKTIIRTSNFKLIEFILIENFTKLIVKVSKIGSFHDLLKKYNNCSKSFIIINWPKLKKIYLSLTG